MYLTDQANDLSFVLEKHVEGLSPGNLVDHLGATHHWLL